MCGIVGYIGKENARNIIVTGLMRLEYRGYDSAGLTLFNKDASRFDIYKDIGRVEKLDISTDKLMSHIGIGHTRWATHGMVNQTNSHPHSSHSGRFVIVHNGVIENYLELKLKYLRHSQFKSDTDTEVIAHLIENFSKEFSVEVAILRTLKLLKGSYALLIIDTLDSHKLYAAKNKPPLLIGRANHGITVTSDMMALVDYATEFIDLEDKSFIVVSNNDIRIFDYEHEPLAYKPQTLTMQKESTEKGIFPHFMLKEIHEEPLIIRKILNKYFKDEKVLIDQNLVETLDFSQRVYIIAAGTSMHAGLASKQAIETFTGKPVEVILASEFVYNDYLIDKNPFFILISQSGETADLIAAYKKLKADKYKVLTVTNVNTSSLAKLSDFVLSLEAGPEIAVASTKAYVAQICVLMILAYRLSSGVFPLKQELSKIASNMEAMLSNTNDIQKVVSQKVYKQNLFYIGRGTDYATALEAALKLKEVSYIHTEGFAAGELKHGTIALIEEGTPVIAIITNPLTNLKTRSNLQEVVSRGAVPIVLTIKSPSTKADDIVIEDVDSILSPIAMALPTQLIAYYAALNLGYDIDKPRNLAKSVTVE